MCLVQKMLISLLKLKQSDPITVLVRHGKGGVRQNIQKSVGLARELGKSEWHTLSMLDAPEMKLE
jgi:hypothetical protein